MNGHSGATRHEPTRADDEFFFVFVPSATGGEPTANGRAAQGTVRALQLCTTPATFRRMHDLLLAFAAKHEATRRMR